MYIHVYIYIMFISIVIMILCPRCSLWYLCDFKSKTTHPGLCLADNQGRTRCLLRSPGQDGQDARQKLPKRNRMEQMRCIKITWVQYSAIMQLSAVKLNIDFIDFDTGLGLRFKICRMGRVKRGEQRTTESPESCILAVAAAAPSPTATWRLTMKDMANVIFNVILNAFAMPLPSLCHFEWDMYVTCLQKGCRVTNHYTPPLSDINWHRSASVVVGQHSHSDIVAVASPLTFQGPGSNTIGVSEAAGHIDNWLLNSCLARKWSDAQKPKPNRFFDWIIYLCHCKVLWFDLPLAKWKVG
jgi:hypothetical protein